MAFMFENLAVYQKAVDFTDRAAMRWREKAARQKRLPTPPSPPDSFGAE